MGKVPRVKASCVDQAADGGKWRSPLGQGLFDEPWKVFEGSNPLAVGRGPVDGLD